MDKTEKRAAQKIEIWLKQIEEGDLTIEMLQSRLSQDEKDLLEYISLADTFRKTAHPEPSAEWKKNVRLRILNQLSMRKEGPKVAVVNPQPYQIWTTRLSRLLAAMTIVVAFLLVGGTFSLVAQNALPGDMLYPAKILFEDLQLVTAPDAENAILKAKFAGNRLSEIQLLIVKDRYEDVDIAVEAFEDNVDDAVLALAHLALSNSQPTYPVLLQVVDDMRGYTRNLTELLTLVPSETQRSLEYAIAASRTLSFEVE